MIRIIPIILALCFLSACVPIATVGEESAINAATTATSDYRIYVKPPKAVNDFCNEPNHGAWCRKDSDGISKLAITSINDFTVLSNAFEKSCNCPVTAKIHRVQTPMGERHDYSITLNETKAETGTTTPNTGTTTTPDVCTANLTAAGCPTTTTIPGFSPIDDATNHAIINTIGPTTPNAPCQNAMGCEPP